MDNEERIKWPGFVPPPRRKMPIPPKKAKEEKKEETVIAGSGGQLAPRLPCASMKLIRQAKEMQQQGKSNIDIAKEMKKNEAWVKASLLIHDKLPNSVHEAITNRQLSRTAALQLLLVPADQLDLVLADALKLFEIEGRL